MTLADTIKRDFKRHRSKAAVLGVLSSIMIVLTVRAVFQLHPRAAEANAIPAAMGIPTFGPSSATTSKDDAAPLVGAEAEERIRQSKELWHRLREVRGTDVAVAFAFDASFYPPDPNQKVLTPAITPDRVELQATPVSPSLSNPEALRLAHEKEIREQAHQLIVKSTTVSGTSKPWAIVNQQLLSVGDHINGFEITAIRSREVEFNKDSVTVPVKMPDDFRGQ